MELNRAEADLAACMAGGRECDLGGRSDVDRTLRAEIVRALLTGLPVRTPDGVERSCSWPVNGVRIRGALVAGELRRGTRRLYLADLGTPDGGPLPPLILIDCQIPCTIRLSGARLRRLSLEGCALIRLEATGLVVDGDVILNGVHSAETDEKTGCHGRGRCWIDLRGARIAGGVFAERARLVAPPKRQPEEFGGSGIRYALNLGDARVGNVVRLTPMFEGYGGVRIEDVGGSVFLDGAKLIAEEGDALQAVSAHIGNDLYLRAAWDGRAYVPFIAVGGSIDLSSAQLGGSLFANGARIDRDLYAAGARIGGDVSLSSALRDVDGADPQGCATVINGSVILQSAIIDAEFFAAGVQIYQDLLCDGLAVGGNMVSSVQTPPMTSGALGPPAPLSLIVGGKLVMFGASIGQSLLLYGARFYGEVVAISLVVKGHLMLCDSVSGETLLPLHAPGRFTLSGARIGGNLTVAGEYNAILLDQAVVNDDLELWVRLPPRQASDLADATAARRRRGRRGSRRTDGQRGPRIDLNAARVGCLNDFQGNGVKNARLSMDGFHYDRLTSWLPPDRGRLVPLQRWLRDGWVAPLITWTSIATAAAAAAAWSWPMPETGVTLPMAVAAAVLAPVVIFREWPLVRQLSHHRLRWLALQYEKRQPKRGEFRPEPYERLSRYFRSQGLYSDARRIARRKLDIERRLSTAALLRPLFWLYARLFDHGMGPERAVAVFLVFILIGVAGVQVANEGWDPLPGPPVWLGRASVGWPAPLEVPPVLVIDADPVQPVAGLTAPAFLRSLEGSSSELPCGRAIEPLIYALDAFIPALDLKHERRCSITDTPKALPWRIGFAAYSILGWIITSLTVLTLTGILRRRAEGG